MKKDTKKLLDSIGKKLRINERPKITYYFINEDNRKAFEEDRKIKLPPEDVRYTLGRYLTI